MSGVVEKMHHGIGERTCFAFGSHFEIGLFMVKFTF